MPNTEKTAMPTIGDVRKAAERIKPYAHRTPVMTCRTLNDLAGAPLFFKCENFQRVGAFKFRGACNAVMSLFETETGPTKGVATHSSGNHAQALALAASLKGIPAYIVMPETAPKVKREAVAAYGGKITFCKPTLESREATLKEIVAATGAHVVHPFDDPRVIAGQGTAALELLEDDPDLEILVAPVGGGGLLSGTSIAAHGFATQGPASRGIEIYGAEPQGADDAFRSLRDGKIYPSKDPKTIADGLMTSLSELTYSILKGHVRAICTVSDDETVKAMKLVWERMKIIIEPSSAVAVAAALSGRIPLAGKKVGVILSGGNVDLTNYFGQLIK